MDTTNILNSIKNISEVINIKENKDEVIKHSRDWRGRINNNALCVVFPKSNNDVSKLLKFANNNNLTTLDLSTNCNITNLYSNGNLDLYCIQVCDLAQANTWILDIGPQQYFSVNCNYTSINDILSAKRKLIAIQDIYGRRSYSSTNSLLFFLYDDGSIEKRFILNK